MTNRRVRAVLIAIVSAAGVGIVCWFTLIVPHWVIGAEQGQLSPSERMAAESTLRGQAITLVSVLSGLVVARYGVHRYYLDKDKQRLDEDKHLTGLFDSAAGRLASDSPSVRAVAVRTLHRLMVDSARDHLAVLYTLCDVLRQFATPPTEPEPEPGAGAGAGAGAGEDRPAAEVTAAVDALRERPERPEGRPLDLTGVYLRGADLHGVRLRFALLGHERHGSADLARADLSDADLTGVVWPQATLAGATMRSATLADATLAGSDLTGADLRLVAARGARLPKALLFQADCTGIDLRDADLRGARLRGALLAGADLTGTNLAGADLSGTDLREVRGLTTARVRDAIIDATTALPAGIDPARMS